MSKHHRVKAAQLLLFGEIAAFLLIGLIASNPNTPLHPAHLLLLVVLPGGLYFLGGAGALYVEELLAAE